MVSIFSTIFLIAGINGAFGVRHFNGDISEATCPVFRGIASLGTELFGFLNDDFDTASYPDRGLVSDMLPLGVVMMWLENIRAEPGNEILHTRLQTEVQFFLSEFGVGMGYFGRRPRMGPHMDPRMHLRMRYELERYLDFERDLNDVDMAAPRRRLEDSKTMTAQDTGFMNELDGMMHLGRRPRAHPQTRRGLGGYHGFEGNRNHVNMTALWKRFVDSKAMTAQDRKSLEPHFNHFFSDETTTRYAGKVKASEQDLHPYFPRDRKDRADLKQVLGQVKPGVGFNEIDERSGSGSFDINAARKFLRALSAMLEPRKEDIALSKELRQNLAPQVARLVQRYASGSGAWKPNPIFVPRLTNNSAPVGSPLLYMRSYIDEKYLSVFGHESILLDDFESIRYSSEIDPKQFFVIRNIAENFNLSELRSRYDIQSTMTTRRFEFKLTGITTVREELPDSHSGNRTSLQYGGTFQRLSSSSEDWWGRKSTDDTKTTTKFFTMSWHQVINTLQEDHLRPVLLFFRTRPLADRTTRTPGGLFQDLMEFNVKIAKTNTDNAKDARKRLRLWEEIQLEKERKTAGEMKMKGSINSTSDHLHGNSPK